MTATIVREDLNEAAGVLARAMVEKGKADELENREAEARYRYEGTETYYVLITQLMPRRFKSETLEALPIMGTLTAYGDTEEAAAKEIRMAFARALHGAKVVKAWEDCLSRALNARFPVADVIRLR